eukprot:m.525018 g.525018  ORF g.525018 m.525018 type:complete len:447 (-) comp21997_c0_seq5:972-2312(-)
MSNWFHRPFGHRRKKDTSVSVDTRQPVEIKVRVDGKDIVKVTFHAEMVHADCKNSLLTHIRKRELQHDQVVLLNKEGERVPCVYESFVSLGDNILECSTKPKPWIRALERADLARYADPDSPIIRFQPPDTIFANSNGEVREDRTENTFIGSKLCHTWVVEQYIQSGSFGRGWQGLDVHSGKKVFIKTFRSYSDRPARRGGRRGYVESVAQKQEAAIRKEIEVLLHPKFREATQHPAVVGNSLCYGYVEVPNTGASGEMFFIMTEDLCEGGELFNYLCPPTPPYVRSFTEGTARRLFRQIAAGVAYMHRTGCYHRDLKLENLVVTGDFNVKIMDFGSVKFRDQMETVEMEDGTSVGITNTKIGIGTGGYKPIEARDISGAQGCVIASAPCVRVGCMDAVCSSCVQLRVARETPVAGNGRDGTVLHREGSFQTQTISRNRSPLPPVS